MDAAVIHPPGWDPDSEALAKQAVKDHPGRFAILASPPVEDPALRQRLPTLRAEPGMLGLRYLFIEEPKRSWLHDETLDWLWAGAEQHGIPIAMLATGSEARIAEIAQRHPGLRLTIDHLGGLGGNTTLKDHAAMTHMPDLLALARHPNIAVKVTGAPGYSAEAYPYPIMSGYVRQIFDAFGPERTFWGTDITKMPCTWSQCITQFTEQMPWLSGEDLDWVMSLAVRDWWGWRTL